MNIKVTRLGTQNETKDIPAIPARKPKILHYTQITTPQSPWIFSAILCPTSAVWSGAMTITKPGSLRLSRKLSTWSITWRSPVSRTSLLVTGFTGS